MVKTSETAFDPWGVVLRGAGQVNATQNRFEFLNREKESTFNLNSIRLGARGYNPTIGRFDRIDPLADEPVQLDKSPYAYGWNNPIKYTDPEGRCPDCPENDRTSHGQLQRAFLGHENDIGNSLIDLGKKILSYTDFNDATVIATNITRGGNAINLDGTSASTFDKISAHLGAALPVVSGSAVKKGVEFVGENADIAYGSYKDLVKAKLKDAHHVIQDAAARVIPGYKKADGPSVKLSGPSNVKGTPHYNATQVQKERRRLGDGGTYGSERRIGYRALRAAGFSRQDSKVVIKKVDDFSSNLGVNSSTQTRQPNSRN